MSVPAAKFRTVDEADRKISIVKARMRLLATAMADALAEAQANQPGACERISRILGAARITYLQQLREGTS
jgi:hypothetical protein